MQGIKKQIIKSRKNYQTSKGITLIALVVTIVVLIILATISINAVFGENGIIKRAEAAKELHEQTVKDEENSFEQLVNIYDNVIEGGNIGGGNNPPSGGEEENKIPVIEKVLLTTNTNTIKVDIEATNLNGAIYGYYYKTEGGEYQEKPIYEGTDSSYIITNLIQNTNYTIKAVVGNIYGAVYQEAVGRTSIVPDVKGKIEVSDLVWNQGKASVTIRKTEENDLIIRYKIGEGEEKTLENGGTISNLELNDIVTIRLWDGKNGGDTMTVNVKEANPPTVTVTQENVTSNSITVSVTATDEETGIPVNPTYKYYIKKTVDENYPTNPISDTNPSHEFTGLVHNTDYNIKVVVSDKAGNEGIGEKTSIKTATVSQAEGAISFGTLTWSGGKASIQVTKTMTDSYTIKYKVGNGTEQTITSGGTITNLNLNDIVTVWLTDGKNNGGTKTYTVTDSLPPNEATIDLSGTSVEMTGSLTATVTQGDSQSGIDITSCKWVYNMDSSTTITESEYPSNQTFITTPQKVTLKASTAGKYYLHVLSVDKAGNKIQKISEAIVVTEPTTGPNGKPLPSTVTTTSHDKIVGEDQLGNPVVIPNGFKIAGDSGQNVEEGIVIEDEIGNQFVWIPVSNIDGDGVVGNQGANGLITKKDGSKVQITLGRYSFSSSSPGTPTLVQKGIDYQDESAKDIYIELAVFRESNYTTMNNAQNATAMNLQKFVESTRDNHGYYIARYEASFGSGDQPNSSKLNTAEYITNQKPMSRKSTSIARASNTDSLAKGMLWNYISQGDASKISRNMYAGNSYVESDLVNSYMWDTTIVYIQAMGNENYANTNRGNNSSLRNTGETGDEKCHIFDMAGNLVEWTTEYNSYPLYGMYRPCTYRGGNFSSSTNTVQYYNSGYTTSNDVSNVGFRVGIYIK